MVIPKQLVSRMRPFMKEHGYQNAKTCFYRIQNEIASCVQLDMPGGLVYVTFYVMPLYLPWENRCYTYGNRVSALRQCKFAPLRRDAGESEIAQWLEQLYGCLERFVFPFFQRISTPRELLGLLEENRDGPWFACPPVQRYRLQLFSYFYTCEFDKLSGLLPPYRQRIQGSTFLTQDVRTRYLQETETLEQRMTAAQSREFCAKTVEASLRKCFP